MNTLIGQTIGEFQILEELGRGGMAIVYKAHQRSLDRDIALKVLPGGLADQRDFYQRFRREARAIGMLKHPHIVTVYGFGEEGSIAFIAMEYVSGGTLRHRLGQPMELPVALEILGQVGSALDYAHSHGVIHRDVKPTNILMEGNRAVLSDFGIVRVMEETRLTREGTGMGTPEYASPEQIQSLPLDSRSDVYSLGIVAYEMLTGQVPFRAETPLAVVYKQMKQPPPPPRRLNPKMPRRVEAVLLRALKKDPAERYCTAGDFVKALYAAAGLPLPASLSPVPGTATGGVIPVITWQEQAITPIRTRRRPLILALVLVLLFSCTLFNIYTGQLIWEESVREIRAAQTIPISSEAARRLEDKLMTIDRSFEPTFNLVISDEEISSYIDMVMQDFPLADTRVRFTGGKANLVGTLTSPVELPISIVFKNKPGTFRLELAVEQAHVGPFSIPPSLLIPLVNPINRFISDSVGPSLTVTTIEVEEGSVHLAGNKGRQQGSSGEQR